MARGEVWSCHHVRIAVTLSYIHHGTAPLSNTLLNYERYRRDPVAFLTECVFTLDQVDKITPIKAFPMEFEYLRLYCKIWQKYPLIAVPKSRRLTMSWTNIALYLWDTMFNQGRNQAFVSKKEDDAKVLVEKAEFIFDHIPKDKIPPELLPKKKTKSSPPMLSFPELNSQIQGFPMGADQLRQFTFSGVFGDECAFWPEAENFYAATLPTIEGGGRMSLVSSPAPGFFKHLVFDTLDKDIDLAIAPETVKAPLRGIRLWMNEDNRFLIYESHYTCHPHKRTKSYRESIKKSLPIRKFLQEYELNWDTFEGLPVYPDFDANRHLSRVPLEPKLGLPLLCGWDFGLTPACVVSQLQGGQLVILKEFVSKNKSISMFAPEVMQSLLTLFPEWHSWESDYRHFIDPAGTHRAETDANTCMNVMKQCGLKNIALGRQDWASRRDAVEGRLVKSSREGPSIIMYEPDCPQLSKGFRGGYQYAESAGVLEPTRLMALKNEFSHCHDALQYLCTRTVGDLVKAKFNIETPKYNFQTRQTPQPTNEHRPLLRRKG
jgi:hypothetical protein